MVATHMGASNRKEYFEKWIKYLKLKKMAEIQDGGYTYGGIQTYKEHPNIWGAFKLTGRCPNIRGHSNIQGVIQMWASKHTGGASKCTEGASKYVRASKHTGVSKHKGGVQTYGWCPNMWGHQNIQGASKHCSRLKSVASSATHMGATKHTGGIQTYSRASKYMGGVQTYGGIQTYGGHANIHGVSASKHTGCIHTYGGIQMYGAYGHPLSVT